MPAGWGCRVAGSRSPPLRLQRLVTRVDHVRRDAEGELDRRRTGRDWTIIHANPGLT